MFVEENFDFETIEYEIKLNFSAVCPLIFLLLKPLQGEGTPIILNVNLRLASAPKMSSAAYCGTKGALSRIRKSLGLIPGNEKSNYTGNKIN